ncbi:phenylalanine-4-hydroxylase [Acrasis kona]|uniref:phenylalanine 4-monooxygenase n=1 Tax=Acrasis kona TaxID=1008807 RepID=A0AAW2ZRD0_9EUKA
MARTLLMAIPHRVGALKKALNILSKHDVNLKKIESRPSKIGTSLYDFVVDVEKEVPQQKLDSAVNELKKLDAANVITYLGGSNIPWFPRKISDLDKFNQTVLSAGSELESDHPGFNDAEYRKRRLKIAENALQFKHGSAIPHVEYTKGELEAWKQVYNKLTTLYPTHACSQLNYVLPMLQQNCGYSENQIPQLQDIHNFLKDTTGFRLRPVAGLLSSRDFLNGLAFRVFHSTQYIRHESSPLYTPEPDVCHELLGHVPLFADPDFADFSQEIGLASLAASDDDIKRLGTLYWFTVEYGLCKQEGQPKAYGAGLLSSFGELEYCLTDKPEIRPFEPEKVAEQQYPITTYQPVYFMADSFDRAKEQTKAWAAKNMHRPFAIRYNPYTLSVEVLTEARRLIPIAKDLQSKMDALHGAMEKIVALQEQDNRLEFAE